MINRTQVTIETKLIDGKIELKLIENRRLVPYDFRFSSPYADLEKCIMQPFLKEHFFWCRG